MQGGTEARAHRGTRGGSAARCAVVLVVLLCPRAPVPPCPLAAQRPPDIVVTATPAFRPTAVLLPHLQYRVAVDSATGRAVLRDLTVNPVTFAGSVRVEGIALLGPAAAPPSVADTVRFGGDGEVTLVVADATGPLTVRVAGSPRVPGGRLVITAESWPLNRSFLVTLDQADLYEHRWRGVGHGVRDHIRLDDARGIAFLADSTVANTVVAIGAAPGTRAGLQLDASSMVVERRYGNEVGRERRPVGRLVLLLDPARDARGGARAELRVAVGATEEQAAQRLAAMGADAAPAPLVRPTVTTPAPMLDLLLGHLLAAARPMLDYDRIDGLRHTPAGAYTFLAGFDRDGWYGATAALQLGDVDAVCSEYRLFARYAAPSGAQRHEVWNRLGASGPYVWTDDWGPRWMGDKDPYQLLKGYACYRAARDAAWLAAELPNLRRIARFALASDRDGDGLVEGMSYATYSEMSPLSPQDEPYQAEDPYVNALTAYALERLAELEEEAARAGPAPGADSAAAWRAAARRVRAAIPSLWRPAMGWFAYHALPDGSRSWDHHHLQPVDALVFDGVADTALQRAMVAQVLLPRWWDRAGRGFFAVPPDDPWHDMRGYWRGWGWHILDFKALEAVFRFGSAPQRLAAWRMLNEEADRIVGTNYGRPGERGDNNGLFQFSAGAYLDLVARGLFGVDEHLDEIHVAPHVDGVLDGFTWRLDGWRVAGDTLGIIYRPADRAVTLRLVAPRRTRLVVRFPWLGADACATVRRGPGPAEPLPLVALLDGAAYTDVRGGFEPAEITVAARACAAR